MKCWNLSVNGQWSMLDLFVVILLAALTRFQGLIEIRAETGAAVFGLVVILTMLATMNFDPRHAWDARRQSVIQSLSLRRRGRLHRAPQGQAG
jgi:uncharacterized paraquat-inducible protein A